MSVIAGLVVDGGFFAVSDSSEIKDGAISVSRERKFWYLDPRKNFVVGTTGDVTYGNRVRDSFLPRLIAMDENSFEAALDKLGNVYTAVYNKHFQRTYLDSLDIKLEDLLAGIVPKERLSEERQKEFLSKYYNSRDEFGRVGFFLGGYTPDANRFDVGAVVYSEPETKTVCEQHAPGPHIVMGSGGRFTDSSIRAFLEIERVRDALRKGSLPKYLGARGMVDGVEEGRRSPNVAGPTQLLFSDGIDPHFYDVTAINLLALASKLEGPEGLSQDSVDGAFRDIIEKHKNPNWVFDRLTRSKGRTKRLLEELWLHRDDYTR